MAEIDLENVEAVPAEPKSRDAVWETARYRLVKSHGANPPDVRDDERIVGVAIHPMGAVYLIEKAGGCKFK